MASFSPSPFLHTLAAGKDELTKAAEPDVLVKGENNTFLYWYHQIFYAHQFLLFHTNSYAVHLTNYSNQYISNLCVIQTIVRAVYHFCTIYVYSLHDEDILTFEMYR